MRGWPPNRTEGQERRADRTAAVGMLICLGGIAVVLAVGHPGYFDPVLAGSLAGIVAVATSITLAVVAATLVWQASSAVARIAAFLLWMASWLLLIWSPAIAILYG